MEPPKALLIEGLDAKVLSEYMFFKRGSHDLIISCVLL